MNQDNDWKKLTSVDDLLKKMRAGIKEIYEISLRDQIIPVRIISMDEALAIRREAIKQTISKGGDETDKNAEVQRATLKLASTLHPNESPGITEKMFSKLHYNEVQYLFNEYINITEIANPSLEKISQEQFRNIVDGLKKNIITVRELSIKHKEALSTAYVDLIQRQETQTSPTDN